MVTAPVRVNVYDMYWLNDYASNLGFGIYHSGVEVYGVEYAYGGHQFPFSGIFTNSPQDVDELGENFKFKTSIVLGETALSKKGVENLVKSLGDEFRGDRYHLITKNCNHFTRDFGKELTGLEVPGWVNRLASVSGSIPFLNRYIPQEWLTPIAIEAALEEKETRNHKRPTLNYPVTIDVGQEALAVCGSPTSKNSIEVAGPSLVENGPTSNGSGWKFFRRNSDAQSTPTTARRGSTPPLARLWNSIKNIASEEPSIALSSTQRPTINSMPNTQIR